MKEQLISQVTTVMVEILLALLSLGCAYLTLYLKRAAARVMAETEHIQDRHQAELLKTAIARLDDIATRTVEKLEQTVAGELREKVRDGRIDRSELLRLGEKAYTEVLDILEPGVQQVLQDSLGDFHTYVKNTIESKVLQLKTQYGKTGLVREGDGV